MNFSHYFIKRPIFAGVLSIAIFVMGLLALFKLPISEYPEVVPPTIVVKATYPGANPKTIAETVASPLEQAINGVEEFAVPVFAGMTGDGVDDADRDIQSRHPIPTRRRFRCRNWVSQALPKFAGGSPQPRRHDDQAIPRPHDGGPHLFSPDGRYDDACICATTRRCR